MKKSEKLYGSLLVLGWCWLWCGPAATAATVSHALLVGVAEYQYEKSANLEGPVNDVRALRDLLTGRLGFTPDRITTLEDSQASKANILAAIESLDRRAAPGDFIFIYFSGHGTSRFDLQNNPNISPYTGALLTADFKGGGSREEVLSRLLVGSRDLRPRLEKLEKDREVMVVIDACYSGEAVRIQPIFHIFSYRYVDLDAMVDKPSAAHGGSAREDDARYPYQRTTYISASSVYEKAIDITTATIARGHRTFDGKPHGALTEALCRGLSGAADVNDDAQISANELHQFVRGEVATSFPQTPQLLKPLSASGFEPLFYLPKNEGTVRPDAFSAVREPLRVQAENLPAEVVKKIAESKGIELVSARPHLLVVAERGGYAFYLSSGVLLCRSGTVTEMVDRLGREVAGRVVKDAVKLPKRQNIYLHVRTDKGVLPAGEGFGLELQAEKASHLLLVNIDSGGMIDILYPHQQGELLPVRQAVLSDLHVAGPHFGAEYVMAATFTDLPDVLRGLPEELARRNYAAFTPEDSIIVALGKAMAGPAFGGATVVQMKTAAKEDIGKY